MITKERAEKLLRELLISKGKKDSELDLGNLSLNGSEIISIVQNGQSRQINLLEFLEKNLDNLITVDDELSLDSKFPVQNKVVTEAINYFNKYAIMLKGYVYDTSDLPLPSENRVGDIWIVITNGDEFMWVYDSIQDVFRWELVGKTNIDFDDYFTKEEIIDNYVNKSQLEGIDFVQTLDKANYTVTTSENTITISGNIKGYLNTLFANNKGNPDVDSQSIIPSYVHTRVIDKDSNTIYEQILTEEDLSNLKEITFNFPETAFKATESTKPTVEVVTECVYKNVYFINSGIYFNYAKYFGKINESDIVTEEFITNNLDKVDVDKKGDKNYTATVSLKNQRVVYAYPNYLGDLTSIKDSNKFENIDGFTLSNYEINGIKYNVYTLNYAASTDSDIKFYFN